jgi:hypothetical protein
MSQRGSAWMAERAMDELLMSFGPWAAHRGWGCEGDDPAANLDVPEPGDGHPVKRVHLNGGGPLSTEGH